MRQFQISIGIDRGGGYLCSLMAVSFRQFKPLAPLMMKRILRHAAWRVVVAEAAAFAAERARN